MEVGEEVKGDSNLIITFVKIYEIQNPMHLANTLLTGIDQNKII
jgi:hypothetical protein